MISTFGSLPAAIWSLAASATAPRKGMLGAITGRDVQHRQVASAAAALIATQNGVSLLRVHDVAETVDALAVLNAVRSAV
jgi:dihydropteroate synthase